MKTLQSFSLIAVLAANGYLQSTPMNFDNTSWYLLKIIVSEKIYIYKGREDYIVDFIKKGRKRRHILLSKKANENNASCNIDVPSEYEFNCNKQTFRLALQTPYIFPDKCKLSTSNYQIFSSAFNSAGSFESKGDTLIMKTNDNQAEIYLVRKLIGSQ